MMCMHTSNYRNAMGINVRSADYLIRLKLTRSVATGNVLLYTKCPPPLSFSGSASTTPFLAQPASMQGSYTTRASAGHVSPTNVIAILSFRLSDMVPSEPPLRPSMCVTHMMSNDASK